MLKIRKGAIDLMTNKPINVRLDWKIVKSDILHTVITNGYQKCLIKTQYIEKKG